MRYPLRRLGRRRTVERGGEAVALYDGQDRGIDEPNIGIVIAVAE